MGFCWVGCRLGALEQLREAAEEGLLVHWLGEVGAGAELADAFRISRLIMAGDYDDRRRSGLHDKTLQHLKAVHAGHVEIKDDAADGLSGTGLQEFRTV